MSTIFGEVRREVANTLYEQEKRYLEEKREFEATINELETIVGRLKEQLAAEQAKATWSIPKPSCFMQSSPFYGIGVPIWDESTGTLHIKPSLGRPYYITYKGKEYVKVDRAPKEGDVINVTSAQRHRGSEPTRGNALAEVGYVWPTGALTLDHAVFGVVSYLTTDCDFDDKYDAVYELVQNRITYKGKQYVKVDRKPRKGDVVNVTKITGWAGRESEGAELARVRAIDRDEDLHLDHPAHGVSALVGASYGDEYDAVYEPVNA